MKVCRELQALSLFLLACGAPPQDAAEEPHRWVALAEHPLSTQQACATESDCPSSAACAAFASASPPAPTAPRCLARCDASHPCGDPLLACLAANGSGGLGFTLPGSAPGVTVCAPRRCSAPADCPGGTCTLLGTASFCTR